MKLQFTVVRPLINKCLWTDLIHKFCHQEMGADHKHPWCWRGGQEVVDEESWTPHHHWKKTAISRDSLHNVSMSAQGRYPNTALSIITSNGKWRTAEGAPIFLLARSVTALLEIV